jgi:hypothetical protein
MPLRKSFHNFGENRPMAKRLHIRELVPADEDAWT